MRIKKGFISDSAYESSIIQILYIKIIIFNCHVLGEVYLAEKTYCKVKPIPF